MPPTNQKVVVRCLMMSIDGFAAGLDQRLDQPFGDHTDGFTDWLFATRSGRQMLGLDGGEENADDPFVARGFDNIGAVILGRNMFTTSRGPWPDDGWVGWWGPNPPYHAPTFVLTHHRREPLPMEGGTTFHFVSQGIDDALEQALAAADGRDVRVMGGAATVRQFLSAGLIDELHLVVVPLLIGNGERLFPESSPPPGYTCVEHTATPAVMHLRFEPRSILGHRAHLVEGPRSAGGAAWSLTRPAGPSMLPTSCAHAQVGELGRRRGWGLVAGRGRGRRIPCNSQCVVSVSVAPRTGPTPVRGAGEVVAGAEG